MYSYFCDKLKQIYEFVCLAGILLFAVLPLFMVIGPEKYGITFKSFAIVEIVIFMVCIIAYLIFFAVSLSASSGKCKVSDLKEKLSSFFSGQSYAILFVFVFILSVVSAFCAPDRQRALSGTDFRPDGILMYACFISLFFFASSIKNSRYRQTVAIFYGISFFVVSFVMLMQYYGVIGTASKTDTPAFLIPLKQVCSDLGISTGHFYKGMTGTFYNSTHMGYYIAICSGMFTGLFIKSDNKFKSVLFLIISAYSFWILILNNTFGAYIAVFVAILIYGIYFLVTKRTSVFKALLPLILFVCVSVATSVTSTSADKSIIGKNIIQTGKDVKNIAVAEDKANAKGGSGRWQLWVNTLSMIKEEPTIGYGPDNIKAPSLKYRMKMDRAHNEFLEISAAIGIPGAIFYYTGIIGAIICFLKKKQTSGVSLGASLAVLSYFVSSLFGVFLFYTACHLFVMLGLMRN